MTFPTILERARVGSLIPALKEFGVISEETMKKMVEVNSWRVKLVHKLKEEYDLNPGKAKELLEIATQAMSELIPTKAPR